MLYVDLVKKSQQISLQSVAFLLAASES
jgi:hypothetical protein